MHRPFLALDRAKELPARMRVDFLHQDAGNDTTLPTLSERLRNSFPFFGNDWMRTGGIGEFTGGGVAGLRAIAANGWRGEDHTLNLTAFSQQVDAIARSSTPRFRSTACAGSSRTCRRPPTDLVNRFKAIGGGLLVGWGPTRTRAAGAAAIGPVYRTLFDNGIPLGYHSDGGDITVISPWLNFYTMITGSNLRGDLVNDNQVLTRARDDVAGDRREQVVHLGGRPRLDRAGQPCRLRRPRPRLLHHPGGRRSREMQSVLTVIGGKVKYDAGVVRVPKAD